MMQMHTVRQKFLPSQIVQRCCLAFWPWRYSSSSCAPFPKLPTLRSSSRKTADGRCSSTGNPTCLPLQAQAPIYPPSGARPGVAKQLTLLSRAVR